MKKSNSPHIFDRQLLNLRRQRIAAGIAQHDFLLTRLADDLADRLTLIKREFPLCLNLGAHHGVVGRRLRKLPQVGTMIDMESVPALLAQCEGPCVCADEEFLPFAGESLNLVVSGLTLQFVNDLPGVLLQCRRVLKPDGLFVAGLIGGSSLFELRDAFMSAEAELEGGASPRIAPLADLRDLGALLQRAGFALPVVDSDVITVRYETPFALMHELRAMGAGNVLEARHRRPLRRTTLMRAADLYQERHGADDGRIQATFEILTLTAWAPDDSQQKPLRPGSAQTRLADALGVKEYGAKDDGHDRN